MSAVVVLFLASLSAANATSSSRASLPFLQASRQQNDSRLHQYSKNAPRDMLLYQIRGGSDPQEQQKLQEEQRQSQQQQQPPYQQYQHQEQYQAQQQESGLAPDPPGLLYEETLNPAADAEIPPPTGEQVDVSQETVQDRIEAWRTRQRQQAAATLESPRDEQGRVKLLTTVSKGSRAIVFFLFLWRNIHLYEVADQLFQKNGFLRLVCVVPLVLLFCANLGGAIASFAAAAHAAQKKRLKAILNLDKLLEVLLVIQSLIRLSVWPSLYVPREQYIANLLHSVFFLLQAQAFTRLSWDETSGQPVSSYKQSTTVDDNDGDDDSFREAPWQGVRDDKDSWYAPPPYEQQESQSF